VWDPDSSSGGGPGLVDQCDRSIVGRAAGVFLPCIGSVPFPLRKASRPTAERSPSGTDNGVAAGFEGPECNLGDREPQCLGMGAVLDHSS
jgi:hypothetical protein